MRVRPPLWAHKKLVPMQRRDQFLFFSKIVYKLNLFALFAPVHFLIPFVGRYTPTALYIRTKCFAITRAARRGTRGGRSRKRRATAITMINSIRVHNTDILLHQTKLGKQLGNTALGYAHNLAGLKGRVGSGYGLRLLGQERGA